MNKDNFLFSVNGEFKIADITIILSYSLNMRDGKLYIGGFAIPDDNGNYDEARKEARKRGLIK